MKAFGDSIHKGCNNKFYRRLKYKSIYLLNSFFIDNINVLIFVKFCSTT